MNFIDLVFVLINNNNTIDYLAMEHGFKHNFR